jgi:hypothetical protein
MSNNINIEAGNQSGYHDKTISTVLVVFLIVLVLYLLQQLASILMPLVLAFLFASLFQPMIIFFKKKNFPNWIIIPINCNNYNHAHSIIYIVYRTISFTNN